jgi:hypothetical protein
VRFATDGNVTPLQYCHCSRCKKSSGSAFVAAVAARTNRFRWLAGEQEIVIYEAPILETPPPYRNAFCRRCGSPLPVPGAAGPFTVIPAGLFDGDPGTRAFRHIFVGMKAPWYEISDGLPQFEAHVPLDQRLPRSEES